MSKFGWPSGRMVAVVRSLTAKAGRAASLLLLMALAVFIAPSLAMAQTPMVSIGNVNQVEGDSGASYFVFTVTLSQGTAQPVSVNYATSDVTATTADGDYVATSGTLVFGPMMTTQQVSVLVNGDIKVEGDEIFRVTLSDASNATIVGAGALGVILNDDVQPFISGVSPAAGPTAGGNSVVITGYDFAGVTGASGVRFGGANAVSYTVDSNSQITAVAPASAAGRLNITVAAKGIVSPETPSGWYTYVAVPTVTSITPSSGPSTGGTAVAITGTGLSDVTAVTFGATAASGYTVNSPTQITAISPANSAGVYDITVTTAGGTSATSAADQFTYSNAPTSISFTYGLTIAYNAGANATTSINVATGGNVQNSPTHYAVGSATTAQGGTVTINNSGLATYTPPVGYRNANDSFTYTATNAGGTSSPATVTVTIGNPTFAIMPPAWVGSVGAAYNPGNSPITVSGGRAPYSGFSATGLPAGLSISTSGVISGRPTTASNANVMITVTDSSLGAGPYTVSVPVALTIVAPTIAISPGSGALPSAQAGVSYSQTFTSTGGYSPIDYYVAAGSTPPGMTLASNGILSGVPTATGTFSFTVVAQDSSGNDYTGAAAYSITVNAPTLDLSPATLPNGTLNAAYSQTFIASGGTAAYTYALSSGTLPPGLTLSSAGVLSGTPTQAGSFPISVRVTDSTTGGSYATSRAYALTIGAGVQTISFNALSNASLSASPLTLAATATSGLAVSFVSQTATTCSVSGTSLTLLQTGTCTIRAEQAGDASWVAAAPVDQSFTVTPVNLAIVPGAASGLQVGADYSQANTASGGTAPYAYSLAAGAFVPGTTVNPATGEVSGTPTVAGSFSYIVRATDSQPLFVDTPVTTVMIAKGSQTIAFTSAAPSATVPGPDYVVTATANSGLGVTLALDPASSGCVLSGHTVSFTGVGTCVINADQAGDSNWNAATRVQQSFAVLASLPVVADRTGVAVAWNSPGTAIDLSGSITGGAHTSIAVATGPAHGVVSISGDVVTYAPTAGYSGPDSFSYTATGAGGTSTPATVSLTVALPPPPVIETPSEPVVAPPAAGGGSAPVTVDLGDRTEGVLEGYRVTVDARFGSAEITSGSIVASARSARSGSVAPRSVDAFQLVYTPAPNFMGEDTVTLVAYGPGGDSAPVTFTFQVAGKAPNLSGQVASNGSASFAPTTGLVGGPFQGLRITRAPAFGVATVDGLEIVFTPGAVNAGSTSLDYVIELAFGASAAGRIDLVSNQVPGAQALKAETVQGHPVTVRISDTVGGPFTGAAVASVSPTTAGAAAIKGANGVYDLTFTPEGLFAGEVEVGFTLTNAAGTTPGSLTVTVAARPDPSQDPEVRGVASSQVTTARRFADAQIDNFQRRLEALRSGDNGSSNGLSLNFGMGGADDDRDPRTALRRQLGQDRNVDPGRLGDDREREMLGLDLRRDRLSLEQPGKVSGQHNAASAPAAGREGTGPSVGLWTTGSVDWGRQDASGTRDSRFTTQGVTAGLDVKITDRLIIGAGLGYGEDKTRIGDNGSISRSKAVTGAAYASWRPTDAWFVDGVVGLSDLDFDSRRWAAGLADQADGYVDGERSGEVRFAAASVGRSLRRPGLATDLYARLESRDIQLDGFTEAGGGISALDWDALDQSSVSINLGASWRWSIESRRFGRIAPSARLEWARELEDIGAQGVRYADWTLSPTYLVPLDAWSRNAINIDLGAEWTLTDRLMFGLGYRSNLGDASTSHGAEIRLKYGW